MGNEHVTDKQLKNSVFTAFGVMQAIGDRLSYMDFNPQNLCVLGIFLLFV